MISAQTLHWYWHRLRAMDSSEIAGRIAEKTRALNAQRSFAQLEQFRLGTPPPNASRLLPDPASAPNSLRAAVAHNAATIRAGRWKLYGWKEINMPDPPAWDWDAINDHRAPLDVSANQIDHRHLPNGADPRSVWEVNRWSELARLAQNANLNRNLDDARLVQRWLRNWLECNPTGQGINWTSPLEAALRLLHFTWIDTLLRNCDDDIIRCEQERLAQCIVPAHAWWVWRHRCFGSSANNHLIGELAALVLAARRWPCLMHAACCAEKAWQKLQEEVLRQFAPDGGNREQALHYHLFAWTLVWQARHVMGPGNATFEERLRRAAAYINALAHPREPWDFGDCDDAELTPFTDDRSNELGEWLGWLRGEEAGEALRFWLGAPPVLSGRAASTAWEVFPGSGVAVKRTGSWMARFDASPLGLGSMAAHGHLDALHLSIWHGESAVLIDPGTGAYYSDAECRNHLASWEAHNAPVPEAGRHAPHRNGPFLWGQHHEAPRLRAEDDTATACLACDGPFVKRQVGLRDAGCDVLDYVCTSTPHIVTWTFAPGWQMLRTGSPQAFRLVHTSGLRLALTLQSDTALRVTATTVEVSRHFLQRETAPALRVRFSGTLKTSITVDRQAGA